METRLTILFLSRKLIPRNCYAAIPMVPSPFACPVPATAPAVVPASALVVVPAPALVAVQERMVFNRTSQTSPFLRPVPDNIDTPSLPDDNHDKSEPRARN